MGDVDEYHIFSPLGNSIDEENISIEEFIFSLIHNQ